MRIFNITQILAKQRDGHDAAQMLEYHLGNNYMYCGWGNKRYPSFFVVKPLPKSANDNYPNSNTMLRKTNKDRYAVSQMKLSPKGRCCSRPAQLESALIFCI